MYIGICTCSRPVEKFRIALWRATFGSSGGCQKRSVGKKEPWSQRSPRYSALSGKDWIRREIKPTRATNFLSSTRENEKKGERGEKEAWEGDEGIDIGNGGGYIFQNIGYLRGKLVVCILMDRPVYGAQFISKSKVMAAGLHPVVFPPPSWSSTTLDRPRPYSQVPAATTLKFQTNTKMAGSNPDMYCPIFQHSLGNKRSERHDIRRISSAYASINNVAICYIPQQFLISKYNNSDK